MTRNCHNKPTRCVDGRLMRHDPQPDDPGLETDFEEIAQLQQQVFELKMSLGTLAALMQYDIEDSHMPTATPTRVAELTKAHALSRFA